MAMNAWIVAVGSEMLTPLRTDTNSLTITERLNARATATPALDHEPADHLQRPTALAGPAPSPADRPAEHARTYPDGSRTTTPTAPVR